MPSHIFGEVPFLGGTLSLLDPGIADPVLDAIANQLGAARRESFNLAGLTPTGATRGNPLLVEERIREVLGRPIASFSRFGPLEHLGLSSTATLIDPRTPTARVPSLSTLGSVVAAIRLAQRDPEDPAILPATLAAGIGLEERRRLAEVGARATGGPIRNPFRSLQAGPFTPCSADDPRGRCLTPGAKRIANRLVRQLAAQGA